MDIEHLRRVRKIFGDAEHAIKILEHRGLAGGLSIPSLNQLRYVSHHVLNHVIGDGDHELQEAEIHCKRTIFDCREIEILMYEKTYDAFKEEFDDVPISAVVPQSIEWNSVFGDALTFVRTHSQTDGRWQYYDQLQPHIDKLHEIHKKLPHAECELHKYLGRERRNRLRAVIGIVFGIVGTAIGVASSIWPEIPMAVRAWIVDETPEQIPSELPPHLPSKPSPELVDEVH